MRIIDRVRPYVLLPLIFAAAAGLMIGTFIVSMSGEMNCPTYDGSNPPPCPPNLRASPPFHPYQDTWLVHIEEPWSSEGGEEPSIWLSINGDTEPHPVGHEGWWPLFVCEKSRAVHLSPVALPDDWCEPDAPPWWNR